MRSKLVLFLLARRQSKAGRFRCRRNQHNPPPRQGGQTQKDTCPHAFSRPLRAGATDRLRGRYDFDSAATICPCTSTPSQITTVDSAAAAISRMSGVAMTRHLVREDNAVHKMMRLSAAPHFDIAQKLSQAA